MAKKNIHPEMHDIILVLADGSEITTQSTYGKSGMKITLESDPSVHRAWKGGSNVVVESRNTKVMKFNAKFGDFSGGFGSKK